jgi:hypothetical protein
VIKNGNGCEFMVSIQRLSSALRRRICGFFSNLRWTLRWNFGKASFVNHSELFGHLLIVKNSKYVPVARVCIASFLHFNPNAVIQIHCDSTTYSKTKSMVRLLSKRNQIQVRLDQTDHELWQLSKLKIIREISGTTQFYMDADLKWNGPLPLLKSTTFFVREFLLKSKPEYLQLLQKMNLRDLDQLSMKNTSFFSWCGHEAPEKVILQLFELWETMMNTIEEVNESEETKISLKRISEQLCLSILVLDEESNYLKDSDAQFDGTFVESSYFGATGTRFGWLGITSR